jgi:hypothetical protein
VRRALAAFFSFEFVDVRESTPEQRAASASHAGSACNFEAKSVNVKMIVEFPRRGVLPKSDATAIALQGSTSSMRHFYGWRSA